MSDSQRKVPQPPQQGQKQQPSPGGQKPQGGQQQQQGSAQGQYGEGNYKATREYNAGLKEHMEKHDIEREARDAAPKSEQEARDMERAEQEGKRHAKDGGAK